MRVLKKLGCLCTAMALMAAAPQTAHADNDVFNLFVNKYTHYDYRATDDDITYMTMYYDQISIADSGYEDLKNQLAVLNEEAKNRGEEFLVTEEENARELLSSGWGNSYFEECSFKLNRADNKMFSVSECTSSYYGGAHGSYYLNGHNYDSSSGKELSLRDISTDYDRVYQETMNKLSSLNANGGFFESYPDTVRDIFYGEHGANWYADLQGIHIVFNQYEIACYAAGMIEVVLPFKEYPDLFAEKYVYTGTAAIEPLDPWAEENAADYNSDGSLEQICFSNEYDNDNYTSKLSFTWNGTGFQDEMYGSITDLYMVTGADGKMYLYVQGMQDNDWQTLYIYDLNGAAPTKVGEFYNTGISDQAFEYPDRMYLESRINLLGTYGARRVYFIGDDGSLKAKSGEFTLMNNGIDNGITSALDLQVTLLDEEGNEQGEAYFPAGTVYHLRATDNKTYVNCELDDGTRCRIKLEGEAGSYPRMIHGVPEDECFEMLPYAG